MFDIQAVYAREVSAHDESDHDAGVEKKRRYNVQSHTIKTFENEYLGKDAQKRTREAVYPEKENERFYRGAQVLKAVNELREHCVLV